MIPIHLTHRPFLTQERLRQVILEPHLHWRFSVACLTLAVKESGERFSPRNCLLSSGQMSQLVPSTLRYRPSLIRQLSPGYLA
jgi:hypothetical protein